MGWSGGIYTRARDFTDDEANGIKMLSANFDEEHDEIETGLNNCLCKDGQNSPSADLPMATHKHTGCGDAAQRNQYATFGQVQDNSGKSNTSSGTGNTYTLALSPSLTAYADGQVFFFKADKTNTDTSTMNIDSLGAVTIYKNLSVLSSGDITINRTYMIVYYTGAFHLFSQVPASADPQYKIVVDEYGSNDTWTCPTGVTKAYVECWGGGGGAGSQYGGQGGCYASDYVTVTPSTGYSITVGSGGSSGNAGGDSIFGSNLVKAKGGAANGSSFTSGAVGNLVVYGNTGLQYTKDMDSTIEGYFGGSAFMGVTAPNMFMNGSNPAGGGSVQRVPSVSSYSGGVGLVRITYVELV
jgi:hypothetical protein